jgi:hypothetical protein
MGALVGCVGKGREHDRMDLGTPLWGVREVERPKGFATRHAGSQSRGAEAYLYALWVLEGYILMSRKA